MYQKLFKSAIVLDAFSKHPPDVMNVNRVNLILVLRLHCTVVVPVDYCYVYSCLLKRNNNINLVLTPTSLQ